MLITVLQILVVLIFLVFLINLVLKITRKSRFIEPLPDHFPDLLRAHVRFYRELDDAGKKFFEQKMRHFFTEVRITGIGTDVEDIDQALIGAAAVIPVYAYKDWEYIDLHEVLLYPVAFSRDFDQVGYHRNITGMVGSGPLQNVMILSKQALREGFINEESKSNSAIHEFAHLIDKMDGSLDGVPQIFLAKQNVEVWNKLVNDAILLMQQGRSDIDLYALTNKVEFFAVVTEYFFKRPDLLRHSHPELCAMMEQVFLNK